jgi:hypothetical protein
MKGRMRSLAATLSRSRCKDRLFDGEAGMVHLATYAKRVRRRSGVPAERRETLEIERFGFLPRAAPFAAV